VRQRATTKASNDNVMERLSLFLASGCYLGLIPGAPGTYASLATAFAFFLVHQVSNRIVAELHLSAICLIATAGTLASAEVERKHKIEDPQFVVIDEIAGQLVALFLVPVNLINLVVATALFRVFDIWKPYPIRRLERLPNGVGVMADDLLAGVYANVVVHLVNWLLHG
jgi:phosphatidylglycerophosphatase A